MQLIFRRFLIVVFGLGFIALYGQKISPSSEIDSLLPASIYQSSFLKEYGPSAYSIKNEFLKTRLNFRYLNMLDIVEENYRIPLSFGGGPPTKFIYETYKDIYHRKDLQRSFFKLSSLYDLPKPRKQ